MRRRDPERDSRGLDLALGPHDPLRHRRLRHEEGARDLAGRQPAHGAQRERHLDLGRERRVAAGEDQLQALIWEGGVAHALRRRLGGGQQPILGGEHPVAADAVDRAVARGGDQPPGGAGRNAVPRPAVRRGGERLLGGFFGEIQVA